MIGFLLVAAQWIWNGIQVVADVTVHVLSIVVGVLWSGLKAAGSILASLGRDTWKVFRATWDHVLKPAWTKFFRFVNAVHDRLERIFGPVLRKLNALRSLITGWWKKYVRPVLDILDITRRALRVAATLHIPFAAALDQELGRIEEAIQKPFLFLLAKVNEVINIINRIVTLDGLLQRIALIGSLERDYLYAWRAIANPYSADISDPDKQAAHELEKAKPIPAVETDFRAYITTGGGDASDLYRETLDTWRAQLALR